jgi:hypothetical protein
MLRVNSLWAAAQADFFFLLANGGDKLSHAAHVLFKTSRGGVNLADDLVCKVGHGVLGKPVRLNDPQKARKPVA